ncbi:MAG: hypothetical protein HN417_11960 [Desulfobacula sp.]|jgi:hypothetical protein|nr:hypothetical protein [Desulfobacula sp.]
MDKKQFWDDRKSGVFTSMIKESSKGKHLYSPKDIYHVMKPIFAEINSSYRNRNALGPFQACRGGRLLFLEDEVQRILRRKSNAISKEERQMESSKNDKKCETNKTGFTHFLHKP